MSTRNHFPATVTHGAGGAAVPGGAAERLFRAAFKTGADAFVIAGLDDGRLVEVNDRFVEMYGYSRDEVLGHTSLDLGLWAHPDRRTELFAEAAAKGGVLNWPVSARRKDGTTFPVLYSVSRLEGSDPPLILGVIRDVTEQRRMEEELRASEARFRTVVDKAPIAIGISRSGVTIYGNQKYLEMFGYASIDEVEGRPISELWSDADAAAIQERARQRALGLPVPSEYEATARRRDNSLFPAHVSVARVELPDGPASMGFITDLSEQKRAEEENRRLEAQFRQAQRMEAIGQLAGGVAHDFNNILAAMMMQAELIATRRDLPPGVVEDIRQLSEDAERAANLTRQLLLFSRRQVMQPRDLSVNELVINLARMLQRIIGEDVRLQLHLSSRPLATHGDPGMLDQVIMNLVVNARDAMPSGGEVIIGTSDRMVSETEAVRTPDTLPGRYVCLSVSDTGCGIPGDILPRIFEPFFTTKEPGRGTGLGLATVFGIVKQHRGTVLVESQEGRGTTFRVLLPALEDSAREPRSKTTVRGRGGTETILVVEDDERVRELTRVTLERAGYKVFAVADGSDAGLVWSDYSGLIRLVVTDLVMPRGIGGRELASRLRALSPSFPVVFMSGYSADLAGQELVLEPGQRFVQKPYEPRHLLETVRDLLDESLAPE